jgi:cytochrome c-type biogenesis protein CcmH
MRWRVGLWVLLAVALGTALAIGAGGGHGSPSTPAQRAASLDGELRCPSCDDLSVADSSAASAVAIRQLVLADTEAGESQASIVSYLQSRYPGILLRPPASGIEGLVWYAPIAGFVVAAVAVVVIFRRRQSAPASATPAEEDRRLVSEALSAVHAGPGL